MSVRRFVGWFQRSVPVRHGGRSRRFDHSATASIIFPCRFLRVLRQIVEAGIRNNTDVTLCGEMAGKPISALALLGLGFRSISMSPASIGPIKAMLGSLDVNELGAQLADAMDNHGDTGSLRHILTKFAERAGISL